MSWMATSRTSHGFRNRAGSMQSCLDHGRFRRMHLQDLHAALEATFNTSDNHIHHLHTIADSGMSLSSVCLKSSIEAFELHPAGQNHVFRCYNSSKSMPQTRTIATLRLPGTRQSRGRKYSSNWEMQRRRCAQALSTISKVVAPWAARRGRYKEEIPTHALASLRRGQVFIGTGTSLVCIASILGYLLLWVLRPSSQSNVPWVLFSHGAMLFFATLTTSRCSEHLCQGEHTSQSLTRD